MTTEPANPNDSDTHDPASERVALASDGGLLLTHSHAEPLAQELAHLLVRLIEDQHTFVIIEIPGTNRYVQFIAEDGHWLRGETVGNRNMGGYVPLTTTELNELELLGWNSPDSDTGDSGNYWRMWTPPDIFDAAQLAALTLCRVHHLAEPDHATITAARAATFDDGD